MSEKPEALRLAEWIESDPIPGDDKIASTLRRLHAENERLREEVRNWKKSFVGHVYVKNEDYAELIGERDALKTENERLRRDAERYRWMTENHPEHETRSRVYSVTLLFNAYQKEHIDAAIDAAMEEDKR